ncbi:MAG: hypothetical protein M3430_18875 [Acidobacteriota bacterium]|nr:hypothetical protein [Acidobacteriota bacterium]
MKIKPLALCFLLLISPANPSPLQAQGVSAAIVGTWEDVQKIPPGDELEVKLKSDRTITGRLTTASDSKLALSRKGQVAEVDRADVARIKRVVPKSAARSTLIGAGVGAGTMAGLTAIAIAADDAGGDSDEAAAAVFALGLVGAGIGALVGGAFGLRKKKVVVYEARP